MVSSFRFGISERNVDIIMIIENSESKLFKLQRCAARKQITNAIVLIFLLSTTIVLFRPAHIASPRRIIARHIDNYVNMNQLLNMTDFKYLIPQHECVWNDSPNIKFLVLVHSGCTNYANRVLIRDTWGREQTMGRVKVYFVLGDPQSDATQRLIDNEQRRFKDLIQGNFHDVYRNMSFKHTMSLKWFTETCHHLDYLVKVDDDAFVNMSPLHKYLQRAQRTDHILCQAMYNEQRLSPPWKWAVSPEEYPDTYYPTACRGWAVIYSRDVVERLYRQTSKSKFIWLDDVFITGIVRRDINVSVINLNSSQILPFNYKFKNSDFIFHYDDIEVMWTKTRPYRYSVDP